jgi:hypothetical protein
MVNGLEDRNDGAELGVVIKLKWQELKILSRANGHNSLGGRVKIGGMDGKRNYDV